MQEIQRERIFSSLEGRTPTGTGYSADWNEGHPEGQNIQLAGMQVTIRKRTFSYLECRRTRGRGHSAGWNEGDQQE